LIEIGVSFLTHFVSMGANVACVAHQDSLDTICLH